MFYHPIIIEILAKQKINELLLAGEKHRIFLATDRPYRLSRAWQKAGDLSLLVGDGLINTGTMLKKRGAVWQLSRFPAGGE